MKLSFKKQSPGFTLIEVLVSSAILGLTTFGLLSLLRASDQMAMRARINGSLATLIGNRVGLLESLPYSDFASLPTSTTYFNGSGITGVMSGTAMPEQFLFAGENPSETKFLMHGKPLPGQTATRPLGFYQESVTVIENSYPRLRILYSLQWRDPSLDPVGSPSYSINLNFIKYDPSAY